MAPFFNRRRQGLGDEPTVLAEKNVGRLLFATINAERSERILLSLKGECEVSTADNPVAAMNAVGESGVALLLLSDELLGDADWARLWEFAEAREVPMAVFSQGSQSPKLRGDGPKVVDHFDLPFAEPSFRAWVRALLKLQKYLASCRSLSDARWRFTLSGSEFGIWDWDIKSDSFTCSPALYRLMGREPSELSIRREEWLDWTHPEDRERVELGHRALQDGSSSSSELEYRLSAANAAFVWIHERAEVLEWSGTLPRHAMAIVSDTTERRTSERRLMKLTNYDPLTDLPNRNKCLLFLSEAIDRARATGSPDCLFRVDLSGLAQINQSLGREAGDEILRQVSLRLKACARSPSQVYRLGGKEFALMGERLAGASSRIQTLAEEIARNLERPYQVRGETVTCACHVGACEVGEALDSPEEAIRRAEIALGEASRTRKSSIVFKPTMLAELEGRTRLLHDLKQAVFTDQIRLAYQPIVEGTGRVVGVEALARWHHPTRGVVAANDFISLAEESDLIVPLGAALRRIACQQLVTWAKKPETSDMTLSVNVSRAEFGEPRFATDLLMLLRSFPIEPHLLQLELPESLLQDSLESVAGKMNELSEAGVGLILSDFGTGFSSLSLLKRLPFDELKLDRSFVRDILTDPIDASVSRAILAMAQNLGLEVVAEGVEAEPQVALLSEMGCTRFQGYLFGRPGEAEEVELQCRRSLRSPASIMQVARRRSHHPAADPEVDENGSILIVDDDATTLRLLQRVLRTYPNVRATTNPLLAKEMAFAEPPDLLLLDTRMPEIDGFDLWRELRSHPALVDVPAIFVTAMLDPETELRALSMGAADFVTKPISAARLTLAVRNQLRIKRQTDSLRQQASIDPLTEVANRRSFDRALKREVARALEGDTVVSLLMVDVDHFKSINDDCGHPAGDRCLISIARILTHVVRRPMDLVARYGGEEFAIVLPLSNEEEAASVARRLIDEVAITSFATDLEDARQVTISIGWATLRRDESWGRDDPPEVGLLERADRALLRAKELGRNRACGPADLEHQEEVVAGE